MDSPKTALCLAVASFGERDGGIASVARMSARALANHGLLGRTIALPSVPASPFGKAKFSVNCRTAALTHDCFLFGSANIARALPAIKPFRRPYGVWMHGIEVWDNLTPAKEKALRDASLVLVNSAHTLKRFESQHGILPHAHICPLATESEPVTGKKKSGPPKVLIVGRIDRGAGQYKGHRQLIDCWPQIVGAFPNARLVIVGGGDGLGAIKGRVSRSSARANIDVTGFICTEDLQNHWQAADLFAMPSRGEGFGLVYLEAMGRGIPFIVSQQDAGQELCRDHKTGLAVNLNNPAELPQAIIRLLSSPTLRKNMGQECRKMWQEHYQYACFESRFIKLVKNYLLPKS